MKYPDRSVARVLVGLLAAWLLVGWTGWGGVPGAQGVPGETTKALAATTGAPALQLTPVTIAVPAPSEALTEIYVAKDLGIFARHGLDAAIEVMKMPTALAGLVRGSVTFEAGAGSVIRAIETGLPLKVVYIAMDHPPFLLIGGRHITRISQLRGQTVALKSPQEAITAVGEELLKRHGLPPGSYKYLNAGTTPAQIGVLTKELAQAAVLNLAPGLPLTHRGYHLLASALSIEIPLSGLGVSVATLKARPGLIRGAVTALIEATGVIRSDPGKVLPVMEKEFDIKPRIAKEVYNLIRNSFTANGRPSAKAIQVGFQMDRQALTLAHAKFTWPFQESHIYDFAFLPAR